MTLDEFNREMEVAVKTMKTRMQYLLEKGIEAKLDENIMVSIIQNTISKIMEAD